MPGIMIETVEQVLQGPLVAVTPDAPLAEVYALMKSRGVRACPVVGGAGELRGVVSQVDLLRVLHPQHEVHDLGRAAVLGRPVREVMRRGVITVEADEPVAAAVDLFLDTRVHTLPVVRRSEGRVIVVGVLTQDDLLRHLVAGGNEPPA